MWFLQPSLRLHLPLLLLVVAACSLASSAHKIQTEDECLSSNIYCYECDSRPDPNCGDPFDFSPYAAFASASTRLLVAQNETTNAQQVGGDVHRNLSLPSDQTNLTVVQPKRLPPAPVCHGCCVKITSKTPDGVTFVKRTCTSNLQINYFMVGLVCMKESGDRGKMCFCETDYCNGQPTTSFGSPPTTLALLLVVVASSLLSSSRLIHC